MAEGTPARIDRAALERIIRRAAELQATEHDLGDGLTSEDLLALGREVGIPGRYLQQAMLEERTRLVTTPAGGIVNRLAGPADIVAQRVVRGDPGDVERALLRWIEEHELLCIQRQQPGRIVWEPLGGVQAALRRSTAALGRGRKPFMLSRVETVSAVILGLEPGYTHVALSASARGARRSYVGGSLALAAAGVTAAAVLVTIGAFLPAALAPVPAGLGIGYGVLRRYAPTAARIQLGLERALDHLEQGSTKPQHQLPDRTGVFGLLADELRKALRS